ncbi:MAG: MFS transporter [Rhodospirillales bacterium]
MTSPVPSSEPAARAVSPHTLLRDGKYFRLWSSGVAANTMRWLEMLAVAIYVFDKTSSPSMVAFVLFCRQAPMMLFGVAIGTVAEKTDKKRLLLAGLVTVTVVSLTLGILLVTGRAEIWHIALGAFISGVLMAMDFPVRRNMLGESCGMDRVGAGMALDATTNNITRMLGPIFGGLVLETVGLYGAFFLGAALHGVALALVFGLKYEQPRRASDGIEKPKTGFFADIIESIRYIRGQPVIMATLVITIVLNMLAMPFNSMVPVIGKVELQINAILIGFLASAEGLGAFLGCIAIAYMRTQRFTQVFLFGATIFLAFLLLFSFSTWFWLSWVLLFLAGLGHSGFSVGQSTLIYSRPDPEIRGRVMGLLSMCIGMQPLGVLHIGFLADYFGGSMAVTIITVEGLIALGACWLLWPAMRRNEAKPAAKT